MSIVKFHSYLKMPHVDERPMAVGERPQCDPQKIRIVHVGMGASGMLCAHKAKKSLKNYELVCYEKNSSPGGTWWENRSAILLTFFDLHLLISSGILVRSYFVDCSNDIALMRQNRLCL